ncbi:MAG TPA: SatD family protein [Balneolaceae bacterium]
MQAVITGDIINSRIEPKKALNKLKSVLGDYGRSPKDWEIYRGDSFQLLIDKPAESLIIAMRIKASLKMQKALDARMAVGIGDVSFRAEAVTESNGAAFVRSGDTFEQLRKEKVNLAVRSPWKEFDNEMNLYLCLALIVMDDWSKASAEFMSKQLANKDRSQEELAELLGIGQSSVSERKKRAHYDELIRVEKRFRNRVEEYL